MPTFAEALRSGSDAPHYAVPRVLVLHDAATFSAAFTLLHRLREAGAESIGVPSAQSGNCFGDVVRFELPHSKLAFQVSRKYFDLFPGDPESGRVLMPDHLLGYDAMRALGFDPLMTLRFALEVAERPVRDRSRGRHAPGGVAPE